MGSQRIAYWDNLKFFLIFLVVLGHFLTQDVSEEPAVDSLVIFIYSFHMPLFMFVSGVFHRNHRIREKILFYLSIYVVLQITLYVERRLLGQDPSFHLLAADGVPWFMFALAAFTLLTWGFRNVDLRYVLVISLLLGCFCGYDRTVKDTLVLSRILVFYPFYLAGFLITEKRVEQVLERRALRFAGAGLLLFWLVFCLLDQPGVHVLMHLFTGRNPFQMKIRDFGWLYRVLCYVISALGCASFLLIVPRRHLPMITVFGSRTIQVYFWHRIALYLLVLNGAADIFTVSLCGRLIWVGLAVCVTLIFSLHIFRWPLDLFSQQIYGHRHTVRL